MNSDPRGMAKPAPRRVRSIDVLRGLTMVLMLFVNDLFEPGVPAWLVHAGGMDDRMGLADVVFPAFLFMTGLSIPFAIAARRSHGDTLAQIRRHVLIRSASLLLIGVLTVNIEVFNPLLAGMGTYGWALLLYLCIFLIWNDYPSTLHGRAWTRIGIALGWLGLLALVVIYRAGTPTQITWMHTSWWGILGLIGWGYATAALAYLAIGDRLWPTGMLWLFFVVLNMFALGHATDFLNPLRPFIGPLLNGNVPAMTLAGLFVGIMVHQGATQPLRVMRALIVFGVACVIAGFVLRHWFILSKIQATPSWALLCDGISVLAFALLFYVVDYLGKANWSRVFAYAGHHSLTLYLAPDIIYYALWMYWPGFFFYKQNHAVWLAILGSLGWAMLMIGLVRMLSIIGIRLKI